MSRKGPHLKNRGGSGPQTGELSQGSKILLSKYRNKMCKKFSMLCVLGFVKSIEISIDSEDECVSKSSTFLSLNSF